MYSDPKYSEVDVKGIYYANFSKFVVHKLEKAEVGTTFEEWVSRLAKDRANEIRSSVNKELIKVLFPRAGKENWDTTCRLILEEYSHMFRNVAYKYYDNAKYNRDRANIPFILQNLFYEKRAKNPRAIVRKDGNGETEIQENFDGYMYRMIAHFAGRIRPEVDAELGCDHYDQTVPDKSEDDEIDDIYNIGNDDTETPSRSDVKIRTQDDADITNDETLLTDDEDFGASVELIENLLKKMPNQEQAELIRKRILWRHTYEEMASEERCGIDYMRTRFNKAMDAFIKVSLPEVRNRCKTMFKKYGQSLTNEYHKSILGAFFSSNQSMSEIATSFGRGDKEFSAELVQAYKLLKKCDKKNEQKHRGKRKNDDEKYVTVVLGWKDSNEDSEE
ncbi:MAG: hypothetical protein J6J64_07745 [Alistipes sp.]|nr:hypothetical protein [Alistipes sp.]